MFKLFAVSGLVASTLLATAGAAVAKGGDEAQIRALEAKFGKAFEAKDLDGMMSLYAPDVTVFHPAVATELHGAQAYRKAFAAFLATSKGPMKFTESDMSITTTGGMAFVESVQSAGPADAKAPAPRVRVTDIYRKVSGKWRIVHEHVSLAPQP